jgi:hypothetical protein
MHCLAITRVKMVMVRVIMMVTVMVMAVMVMVVVVLMMREMVMMKMKMVSRPLAPQRGHQRDMRSRVMGQINEKSIQINEKSMKINEKAIRTPLDTGSGVLPWQHHSLGVENKDELSCRIAQGVVYCRGSTIPWAWKKQMMSLVGSPREWCTAVAAPFPGRGKNR